MIIGLTGTLGAGKTEVGKQLMKRGFKHYSVREFLSEELRRNGAEINRDNLVGLANQLRRENSPSYIIEKLYEIAKSESENSVIESIRTQGEVEALRHKGEFVLVSVDALPEIRYKRIFDRKSETDKISFQQFLLDEQREMASEDPNEQNIRVCMELSDVRVMNNGSMEELEKDIDDILLKYGVQTEKTEEKESNYERISKRQDYISWDDYFMGIALLSAKRSKDPSTQVGACIVNDENKILGTGYNGFPIGCSDESLPWAREGPPLKTKYIYVCHAELNAILNSTKSLKGCRMYVPLFPCNECAKAIIQSGIKEVIYMSDKYADMDIFKASKILFEQAGVRFRIHIPKVNSLILDFSADKV